MHRLTRQRDHLIEIAVQPSDVRVVHTHALLRASQEDVERRVGAMAGQIPERDVDRRERCRGHAPGRQRMNALAEALHDLHDVPTVGADQLMQEFVVKERKNRRAAGTDGVPEASATVTCVIGDVDDRQFEGVELLNGIAAWWVHRQADQPRVRRDDGGLVGHRTPCSITAL